MARFVDLEEEGTDASPIPDPHILTLLQAARPGPRHASDTAAVPEPEPPKPTARTPAVEAFQCYPIVAVIVSLIDLNTLDSLSRTSRGIHDGLLQHRKVLMSSTLRCSNEAVPVDGDETFRYRARAGNWYYMEDGRNYNGKSGDCARDLVSECRRCAQVICRNCAIKPPAPVALKERHRRLCRACIRAPIATLLSPPLDPSLDANAEVVARQLCRCDSDGVWLCQPCGKTIRAADHEYYRIWRWRNHYGEVLGGLGTGIGDGDRGVICGREDKCCAAKEREQEIDCDAEDARDGSSSVWLPNLPSPPSQTPPSHHAATNTGSASTLSAGSPASFDAVAPDGFFPDRQLEQRRTSTPQLGPGYARHEIEGIGGVVKRKLVRMVRIGACVAAFEDEKTSGSRILAREVRGDARSWCGWCWRVIPGARDYLGPDAPPSPETAKREVLAVRLGS